MALAGEDSLKPYDLKRITGFQHHEITASG